MMTRYRKLNKFISLKWRWLPVVIIMGIGFFLRVININQTLNWWAGDTSRDILAARHIAFMGETSNGGPSISGGLGYINNSPLYYYFLAVLYRVHDSYLTIPIFFAFFDTIAVLLIFLIGRRLVSYSLALVMAAMWAVNNYEASLIRMSTQPMILPVITVLIIYFLEKSYRQKRIIDFCWYIFFLFFSLNIHYAELTLFPAFVFFGLLVYWKNKFFGKFWYIPFLLALGMFGAWICLTYSNYPFDQFDLFRIVSKNHLGLSSLMVNLGEILQASFSKIFYSDNRILSKIFWCLVYPGMWLVTIKSTVDHDKNRFLLWLLSISIMSVVLVTVMGGDHTVEIYYTHPLEILWIICVVAVIFLFFKNYCQIAGGIISFGLGIVVLIYSSGLWRLDKSTVLFDFNNEQVAFAEKMTQEIVMDSKRKTNFDVIHYVYDGQGGHYYGPSTLWYFLEKEYDQKLVAIANDGNHGQLYFEPLSKVDLIYFICSYPIWSYWKGFENCESLFLSSRKENKYKINLMDQKLTGFMRYKLFKYQPI